MRYESRRNCLTYYAMENKAHYRKNEAEKEGPQEASHVEARDDGTRQKDEQGVQHEGEKTEGKDVEGQGQDDKHGLDDCVDKTQDEGGNNGGGQAMDGDSGQKIGGYEDRDGSDEPVYQYMHGFYLHPL